MEPSNGLKITSSAVEPPGGTSVFHSLNVFIAAYIFVQAAQIAL